MVNSLTFSRKSNIFEIGAGSIIVYESGKVAAELLYYTITTKTARDVAQKAGATVSKEGRQERNMTLPSCVWYPAV
jgi:hypothetical protein